MTVGRTESRTAAQASEASRLREAARRPADPRRWLPCLALALGAALCAPDAEAHNARSCTTTVVSYDLVCDLYYDHTTEQWTYGCWYEPVVVRVCRDIAHRHETETSGARDRRVLGEMAACIRREVGEAVDRCNQSPPPGTSPAAASGYLRCMVLHYPSTYGHLSTLLADYTGIIQVNVAAIRAGHAGTARGDKLAELIVLEKLRAAGVHYPETQPTATAILGELFPGGSPGSSCGIDWNQRTRVVYGS